MKTCVFCQKSKFLWSCWVHRKCHVLSLLEKYVFGEICARSFQRHIFCVVFPRNELRAGQRCQNFSWKLKIVQIRKHVQKCLKMGDFQVLTLVCPRPPYLFRQIRCSLERSDWKLFLHLSARAWTRIGLRMTKKHKKWPLFQGTKTRLARRKTWITRKKQLSRKKTWISRKNTVF